MPFHTHDEPLSIQEIKGKHLPKTYIVCTDFGDSMVRSIGSKEANNWFFFSLEEVMIQ